LQDLTEYGGIENDYGQAVLEYECGDLTLSAYKYSNEHLGERTRTAIVFRVSVDLEKVDKDKLNNFVKYFYSGFYCPYHIRFCEFKTYKSIALKQLNHMLLPKELPKV
jgi:hypothetical protein